jgi:signal transduction histidine kinase
VQRTETRVPVEVVGDPVCEIVCDPDKVKQLLLNLLVNARDACDDGGRVRVHVGLADERNARITVEDDGRGIARAEIGRIFEPFHTSKTRGLGLGLFLCERIAALHGGTIRAESDGPGRGSRFVVTLPVGAGALEPATQAG